MTFEFHPSDLGRLDLSTLDYLVEKTKHDLAIFPVSGVKTDSLESDFCNCRDGRDKNTGAYIPLVITKYYHQAMHFFKIGAFASDMIPKFQISMQDLNPSLLRELAELDHEDREYVLKLAVDKLFEDINSRRYHISISKLLEVELVD